MSTQATRMRQIGWPGARWIVGGILMLVVVVLVAAAWPTAPWFPALRQTVYDFVGGPGPSKTERRQPRHDAHDEHGAPTDGASHRDHDHEPNGQEDQSHDGHDHDGHDHDDHSHDGHDEAASLEISERGLKNIGFEPIVVSLGSFERTITVPGMIVERPGKSQLQVTSPLTGLVSRIEPLEGEAVEPGATLFEIRLTHEDVVTAQRDFLQSVEELEVIQREIQRLEAVASGVVAGRRVLEQKYEKQKIEAALRAQQEALRLHGLSDEQVEDIRRRRKLLDRIVVTAPGHDDRADACQEHHLFHVQKLSVQAGQQVAAGDPLCILADHCELLVEGSAFEDDATRLRRALENQWRTSASLVGGDAGGASPLELEILYLADHVDPDSRVFHFYLRLCNEIALDRQSSGGRRFIQWKYRPGQRLELHVPVSRWKNRIVLPREAVVDEGAESYVFRRNGDHFDRVAVHVEFRDRRNMVIAADGAVAVGDVLAAKGAYQMHLALKNKSGGGVDPHAGHSH